MWSEERFDFIQQQVDEWLEAFTQSSFYKDLTTRQQQTSDYAILNFSDFMYNYYSCEPDDWHSQYLYCCTETIPRKLSSDDTFLSDLCPILSAFFRFLHEQKALVRGLNMARSLDIIAQKILADTNDSFTWTKTRNFLDTLQQNGIEFDDEKGIQKFVQEEEQLAKKSLTQFEPEDLENWSPEKLDRLKQITRLVHSLETARDGKQKAKLLTYVLEEMKKERELDDILVDLPPNEQLLVMELMADVMGSAEDARTMRLIQYLHDEVEHKGRSFDSVFNELDMEEKALIVRAMSSGKHSEERGKIIEVRQKPKIGRNEPCHCGSGKKYKKCCMKKDRNG